MSDSRPAITVLQSVAAPDGTTRYIDQLVVGLPGEAHLLFFSWRTALLGRYDVFHVHWPEYLIRNRNAAKALAQKILYLVLLLRLRVTRTPIVRTLHNVTPHDADSRLEPWLLRRMDAATTLFVALNASTVAPADHPIVTILHGHYRDRFTADAATVRVPGRILNFGLIKPYKGIEPLIEAFRQLPDSSASLRIVGKPSDSSLRAAIVDLAEPDERISLQLQFVDDHELVREIGESNLVVLPYLEMNNSGALLVALSLGRPVLVPASPANRLIADEVGAEWVRLYEGSISPAIIAEALSAAAALVSEQPELSGRDWSRLGEQYYLAYCEALGLTSSPEKF